MSAIEEQEEIRKALESMNPEARDVMKKQLMKSASIEPLYIIKTWLSQFEDDCPIDSLIIQVIAQFTAKFGQESTDKIREYKDKTSEFKGEMIAKIALKVLQELSNSLEAALERSQATRQ